MIRVWSEYRRDSGEFTGRIISANSELDLKANTRPGCVLREGHYDRNSQRVNVRTDEVIEFEPVPPDANHEYNRQIRRFVKKREVVALEDRSQQVKDQIAVLEATQHRALREAALGQPQARARLQEIEDQIAALRADL